MDAGLWLAILNAVPDVLLVIGEAGSIEFASDRVRELLGHATHELLGRPLDSLIPGGATGAFALHRDGTKVPVEVSVARVDLATGSKWVCSLRPARDQQARDAAAGAGAVQLSSVFSALSEGLVVQDAEGRIIEANQAAESVLGLTRDQLLGRSSMDPQWRAIHEDGSTFDGRDHPAMVTLRTGEPIRNQIMGVQVAGDRPRWISINSQPLPRSSVPGSGAVIATFVDVTEQREAFERVRSLARRLESVRDEERREVAHQLHEGLAQELFAIQLSLRHLESEAQGRVGVQRIYEELDRSIKKCVSDARQIANDLHPSALVHLSIAKALEGHAVHLSELSGLNITVSVGDDFPQLPAEQRLLLFRSAQEALANAVKHARATSAVVTLRASSTQVSMDIVDDGIGIAADAMSKPRALGLMGIRERVEARGGWMRIERNQGSAGTTMAIVLPREAGDGMREVPG